ncbi:MAG: hypothetical protein ACJ8FS_11025 [Sphingomicrobium sp.]
MKQVLKIAASAALLMSGPLSAEPASDTSRQAASKAGSPNERVCEDVVVTGSRIASRRFCGTRAEWVDRQRQDRDTIEKAQRSANVGCAVINTHTGTPGC